MLQFDLTSQDILIRAWFRLTVDVPIFRCCNCRVMLAYEQLLPPYLLAGQFRTDKIGWFVHKLGSGITQVAVSRRFVIVASQDVGIHLYKVRQRRICAGWLCLLLFAVQSSPTSHLTISEYLISV